MTDHEGAVGPRAGEALVPGRGGEGLDAGLLRRVGVRPDEVEALVLLAQPHVGPARQPPLGIAGDEGARAHGPRQRRYRIMARLDDVAQHDLGAELPLVEGAGARPGHQAIEAPELQPRDGIAIARAQRLSLPLAVLPRLPERDLVVADQGRHRLALVLLLVGDLPDGAPLRVDLDEAPVAHLELRVHEHRPFVARAEMDLREGHAAVAGRRRHEVALQAARRRGDLGAGDGGQAELAGQAAVGDAAEDDARIGAHLVEIALILVHAEGEGFLRGRSRLLGGDDAQAAPLCRPEQGHGLAKDEDEDEGYAGDDEDAAEGDDDGGQTIQSLDALDAPAGGGHPLPDSRGCGCHGCALSC